METGGAIQPGLGTATCVTFEEPTAGQPHLRRHAAGDDLRLVETTLLASATARRRPRHRVDVVGTDPFGEQSVHEETGEVVSELPAIPVFEAEQDVTGAAGERHCGDHVAADRQTRRRSERETAWSAHDGANPITSGTTRLKDHVAIMRMGV